MIIDTHAHLNFSAYKNDSAEVVRRSLANGVWMVNAGSQYSTSRRAVAMAERHEKGVYAAVGLHPIHAKDEFQTEQYKELAASKKVVALGEIGLDYKPEYASFKKEQQEVFLRQLALAKELDLPVILHCRLAHEDMIARLDQDVKGVIHCFTGNQEQFEKYLKTGLHFGFNGLIFKMNSDNIIKHVPLDKILVETDCPYLTPPQEQGRNEPVYIKHIVNKIAQIKNMSEEELSEITTQNAKQLFNLKS